MIDHDGEEWLTVAEAAERVDTRPATLHVWVARGKVHAHRVGRHTWVRMSDVYTAERKTRGSFSHQRRGRV